MKFVKKANKQELIKSLLNTKIELTKYKSSKFQKFLFSLGITWFDNLYKVKYTEYPYLYIHNNMTIKVGNLRCIFENDSFKKIHYEDYKQYIK